MKKTLLVISSLLLISVLSACGAAKPVTTTTPDTATPATTDSATPTDDTATTAPVVNESEKSPSVSDGDFYDQASEKGDASLCAKIVSEALKKDCESKVKN